MYRDFIYMDTDRIESIIAQLNKGLLEEIVDTTTKEASGKLSIAAATLAKILSLNAEVDAGYSSNRQSNKVLHDYAFNIALKSLEDGKYLLGSDKLGGKCQLGAFILIKGSASLRDYNTARSMLDNTDQLSKLFGNNSQKHQMKSTLDQIKKFIDGFFKDLLLIKLVAPQGSSFVGPLSKKFLREDLTSIIFKYGSQMQEEWTMLAQISSIPTSDNKLESFQDRMSKAVAINQQESTAIDTLDPIIEALYGLQETMASVSQPALAVTPIAIYRELSSLR